MVNYSYATVDDAINAVSSRLYDQTNQQWTRLELKGYVVEALRTWGALTGFWRAEMVFPLTALQWWYDLRAQPGTLTPYTVQQYDLITQIENHLLEPPTPASWSGSGQFSLADITTALQRRQDDTLGVSGCTITQSLVNAPVGGRIVLPDNVIDIRRVAWLPTPGFGFQNKILRQSDMWAERAFNPFSTVRWQCAPSNWMQSTEPPISFDVDTVVPVSGKYDVLTVNAGPAWTLGTNATLNIPDDWTWVPKWGALMDLLSRESNAKDALRADYCRRRYKEGVALLAKMPTLLSLRINNLPISVGDVRGGDDFNASWQAKFPSAPSSAYVTANLLAFAPAPNGPLTWGQAVFPWGSAGSTTWATTSGGPYSVTASLVQNAPVGGLYIQVARDDFDTVVDYAHHLAMFKAGGDEFAATVPLYQQFQRKAALYSSKLGSMGFFEMPQLELSQLQEQRNPRYLSPVGAE